MHKCPSTDGPELGGFVTKDSGEREVFDSGAQRDTGDGKGRPGLLSPFVLTREAQLLERGAVKYCDRNWERGMPFSRATDSMFRHLLAWMSGDMDGEDHLAAIRWNAGVLMHFQEMIDRGVLPASLNDMPFYHPPPKEDADDDSPEVRYFDGGTGRYGAFLVQPTEGRRGEYAGTRDEYDPGEDDERAHEDEGDFVPGHKSSPYHQSVVFCVPRRKPESGDDFYG